MWSFTYRHIRYFYLTFKEVTAWFMECTDSSKFTPVDIGATILDTQSEVGSIEDATLRNCPVPRQLHHRMMPSHRPATYRADVVNRALISRDDVKRQPGRVQTIKRIEVSDSNEWYRLGPFHYANTVTRRGGELRLISDARRVSGRVNSRHSNAPDKEFCQCSIFLKYFFHAQQKFLL